MQGWRWFWLAASFVLASGAGVDARASGGSSAFAAATGGQVAPPARQDDGGPARLAALPLRFEPNAGQFEAPVSFLARGPGYSLLSDAGRGRPLPCTAKKTRAISTSPVR